MVNMRTHDSGDLIVQFDVEFPSEKSLSPEALKVYFQWFVYLIDIDCFDLIEPRSYFT